MNVSRGPVLGAAVAVTVLGALGAGLWMAGPPSEARRLRLDVRRVEDLQALAAGVDVYWSRHGSLPASLQVLTAAFPERAIATDPVSRQAYEYRVVTEWTYELCAVFERESQRDGHRFAAPFWQHGPGRQCYELRPNPVTPRRGAGPGFS